MSNLQLRGQFLCHRQPTRTPPCPPICSTSNDSNSNLLRIITDELNASKNKSQPMNLLKALDSAGLGVTTSIIRSWWGPDLMLEVAGSWHKDDEARRMSLLPVYQERIVADSKLLGVVLDLVCNSRPGYIPDSILSKVRENMSGNGVNPYTVALTVPELTMIAVAVLPLDDMEALVDAVLTKVEAKYSDTALVDAVLTKVEAKYSDTALVDAVLTKVEAKYSDTPWVKRSPANREKMGRKLVSIRTFIANIWVVSDESEQEEAAATMSKYQYSHDLSNEENFFNVRRNMPPKGYAADSAPNPLSAPGRVGVASFGRPASAYKAGTLGREGGGLGRGTSGASGGASFAMDDLAEGANLASVLREYRSPRNSESVSEVFTGETGPSTRAVTNPSKHVKPSHLPMGKIISMGDAIRQPPTRD
eukprot:gene6032-3427_t